jgi:hypothetical protein
MRMLAVSWAAHQAAGSPKVLRASRDRTGGETLWARIAFIVRCLQVLACLQLRPLATVVSVPFITPVPGDRTDAAVTFFLKNL